MLVKKAQRRRDGIIANTINKANPCSILARVGLELFSTVGRRPMQPTVGKANEIANHDYTRCSAIKRYNSSLFLNYNYLDKSTHFYQFKAFGFYGSQIVGFAGLDGFYGLSPHFQDWNS